MKSGRAKIDLHKIRFRITCRLHLGNVEKPPHPQFFAKWAPEA